MMKENKKEFTIKTKGGSYRISVWFDKKDKAYIVRVPSLPEVLTFGKSLADAKKMAKDAIELYCDCQVDEGKIVIDDEQRVVGKLPKSHVVSIK